jgi:hypothetical protein
MAVITIYRIAEEALRIISGGDPDVASKVHINELKISAAQVANSLLKVEYFNTNVPMGEMIPNGAMLGLYENILVEKWKDRSRCTLPIKPLKLPRDLGVYSVFPSDFPDNEFIPLQMGQAALLTGQPLLNSLIGNTRTTYGMIVEFSQDITLPDTEVFVSMRLVILDISQYGDYDPLPILPEHEFEIKRQLVAMYINEPVRDTVVDPAVAEQKGVPVNQQIQS